MMRKEKKYTFSKALYLVAGMLLGAGVTALAVAGGYYLDQSDTTVSTSVSSSAAASESDSFVDSDFLYKLLTIESLIKNYYYLDEVDNQTLADGVFAGLLDSLGDVYSTYYTVEETESLAESTEGAYYGIGTYVQQDADTGYVKITGVISGTPAEEAGFLAGDVIYEVDGENVLGLDSSQVVALIKGDEGTWVTVTVMRGDELLDIDVQRRRIETVTVTYELLDDNIAYVQLTEFDDVTVDQFEEALEELEADGAVGLILDLRDNPGGSLYSVVEIADMLLGEGLILYTEDNSGNREEYTSDAARELELPIVLLVNENSASAAEVLTGALKDHGKATVVGVTTYGKGIVQTVRTLSDGSSVKLTTSAYYTPNGTNIHGVGITPDVEVELDTEAYLEDGSDNQLETAVETMKDLLGD
ncbi:MAG: S41 family peptidase [Lachnospiraceae bacterium]|nr:S41 family peptidase [Lachnospiraceae bacterium]